MGMRLNLKLVASFTVSAQVKIAQHQLSENGIHANVKTSEPMMDKAGSYDSGDRWSPN